MKLSLVQDKGIQVLTATGAISAGEIKVLSAGITKLLRDGKNRIVLEFRELSDVSTELIRECAKLDLLARELSGSIVIAELPKEIKQKVASFMKPPSLRWFETREAAVACFFSPPTREPAGPGTSAPSHAHSGPPAAALAAPGPTMEDIKKREQGDVGALRKRIAFLEEQNRTLNEQLAKQVVARRPPPDEAAYQTQIQSLEAKVSELLAEMPKPEAGS